MRIKENVDLINLDQLASQSIVFDDGLDIAKEVVSRLTVDPVEPQYQKDNRVHIHTIDTVATVLLSPFITPTVFFCSSITKNVDFETIGHDDAKGCLSYKRPGTWCGGI